MALLLIAMPMLRGYVDTRARDLHAMSPEEVRSLHPIMISANASDHATSLVVARANPQEWASLASDERRHVARDIAQGAADRGTRNVLLYESDRLVLEIAEGDLIYVESRALHKEGAP